MSNSDCLLYFFGQTLFPFRTRRQCRQCKHVTCITIATSRYIIQLNEGRIRFDAVWTPTYNNIRKGWLLYDWNNLILLGQINIKGYTRHLCKYLTCLNGSYGLERVIQGLNKLKPMFRKSCIGLAFLMMLRSIVEVALSVTSQFKNQRIGRLQLFLFQWRQSRGSNRSQLILLVNCL